MESTEMIVLDEFCASHRLEISFILTLEEHGLIETIIIDKAICIPGNELTKLEKIVRLHQELNINPEGIDAIHHLLERIEHLQNEIIGLRNKLDFYEEESER